MGIPQCDLSVQVPLCSNFGVARRLGLSQRGGREVGREVQGGASSSDSSPALLFRVRVSSSVRARVPSAPARRRPGGRDSRRPSTPEPGAARLGEALWLSSAAHRLFRSGRGSPQARPILHLAGRRSIPSYGDRLRLRSEAACVRLREEAEVGLARRVSAPRWGSLAAAGGQDEARASEGGRAGGGGGWLSSF